MMWYSPASGCSLVPQPGSQWYVLTCYRARQLEGGQCWKGAIWDRNSCQKMITFKVVSACCLYCLEIVWMVSKVVCLIPHCLYITLFQKLKTLFSSCLQIFFKFFTTIKFFKVFWKYLHIFLKLQAHDRISASLHCFLVTQPLVKSEIRWTLICQ